MIRGHEIRIVQKNAYTIVIPTGNTKSKQKTNKYAVCLYCIEECARNIVVIKKECSVMITWQIVRILKIWYNEREYVEILALCNDDFNNKVKKELTRENVHIILFKYTKFLKNWWCWTNKAHKRYKLCVVRTKFALF